MSAAAFWALMALGIILLAVAVVLAWWDDWAEKGDDALYNGPEDDPRWPDADLWYLRGSDE